MEEQEWKMLKERADRAPKYPKKLSRFLGDCIEEGWMASVKQTEHGYIITVVTDRGAATAALRTMLDSGE